MKGIRPKIYRFCIALWGYLLGPPGLVVFQKCLGRTLKIKWGNQPFEQETTPPDFGPGFTWSPISTN